MAIEEDVKKAVEKAVEVHENFEGEIDPWLERWGKSPFSGWIACGMGVSLLIIGGAVGFVLGKVF